MSTATATDDAAEAPKGLGTFGGVFTPSILTILGVIMYLRLGWVVGNAGLYGSMAIITLSSAVTFVTGLSVSALSTNMKVKTGGAYFLLSRSFGLELGGAIGLPLYASQALSIAIYILGFSLSLEHLFGLPLIAVKYVTLAVLTLVALVGASFAIKTQYIVMAAITASLVAFASGAINASPVPPTAWGPFPLEGVGFWPVFAVFFPAVTGILSGVSMSGDLANPQRSLPRGTMAAVVAGYAIYMVMAGALAFIASPDELIHNDQLMIELAERVQPWMRWAVVAGLWGATLSSALGCILSAPRTLQALSNDRLVPEFLGRGSGAQNEPRLGVVLSASLGALILAGNNLNLLATVLSMFYLATYGATNLAAGLSNLARVPSYRPLFRVPWWISILGGVACFSVMFLIDWRATLVAMAIMGTIYGVLVRREMNVGWGDIRHALWMSALKEALHRQGRLDWHVTNWRPNVLLFASRPREDVAVYRVGYWLGHQLGFVAAFYVLIGEITQRVKDVDSARKLLGTVLERDEIECFQRVHIAHGFHEGARDVVQSYGLGDVQANTVVLPFPPDEEEQRTEHAHLIADLCALNKSVVLVRQSPRGFGRNRRILVWWKGGGTNAGLLVLMAHIIQSSADWQGSRVTVRTVVQKDEERSDAEARIAAVLLEARIRADAEVVVPVEGRTTLETIRDSSQDADLVMFGLPEPAEIQSSYWNTLERLTNGLPSCLLVRSQVLAAGEEDFLI